ncbi:MAG: penicillin-binding protein 1A [Gammaproteobacteria bacterium]
MFVFKILWKSLIRILAIAMVLPIFGLIYLEQNLPSVESLKDIKLQVPLKVFSKDGKLLGEFGEKRRIPIELKQVPPQLLKAMIATEDQRFYEHQGVDFIGVMRAVKTLITTGSKAQGGSTITMQVARNFFLSREKTFLRKINEMLLAFKIERNLSKDEILNLYINRIYFGKRAYGIAAAAEVYYGKTVDALNLSEMAMLAGLPQAPSSINPIHSPEQAKKRRQHVLSRMLELKYINAQEYEIANNAALNAKYHGPKFDVPAPYVAEMVRQEIVKIYGEEAYDMGLSVYTSIDARLQQAANAALYKGLVEYDKRHGFRKITQFLAIDSQLSYEEVLKHWQQQLSHLPHPQTLKPAAVVALESSHALVLLETGEVFKLSIEQMRSARPSTKSAKEFLKLGAVIYLEPYSAKPEEPSTYRLAQIPKAEGAFVALHPDSGAILALVGGFDYAKSSFNRVTQAERQPGSSFKPFIYSAALEHGFTLASVVSDAPVVYYDPFSGPWRPRNDKNRFYGPSRLRLTLARSQNTVSARLLQSVGISNAMNHMAQFGINTKKLPPFLSLALGSGSMTPLELGSAYCVFANGGYRIEPYFIEKIQDINGQTIFQPLHISVAQNNATRAIPAANAFLITSALQDAIRIGTGVRAKTLGRSDLSGKTGTTNDEVDAWYAGFNRDIVATVWMGFDNPKHPLREYGSQAALPVWIYFMEAALKGKPENTLAQPPEVVQMKIDPQSGGIAQDYHKGAILEFFAENKTPNNSPNLYDGIGDSNSIAPTFSPESLF